MGRALSSATGCRFLCLALHKFTLAGGEPSLLFTNRWNIRQFALERQDYTQLIGDLRNVVALDADMAERRIFWADVGPNAILR